MKQLLTALFLALLAFPCLAGTLPQEFMCSFITKVDGGYKIVLSKIRVIEQVQQEGPFKLPAKSPKDVVSVICFRSSIVPVLGDRKVLDAGYYLDLMSRASGTVELSKVNNVYKARQISGSMSASKHEALVARLKEMNERVQPSKVSDQASKRSP